MKTKRISAGIYDVTMDDGTVYELEQYPDGNWLQFERHRYGREYCTDYPTKAAALAAIQRDH